MIALQYLLRQEWSMGNGQCPECLGAREMEPSRPSDLGVTSVGHKANCYLAASLVELGDEPLMQGELKSEREYELWITSDRFLSQRPKPIAIGEHENFEQWVTSTPIARSDSRYPPGNSVFKEVAARAGAYRDPDVELAWQAWIASWRTRASCPYGNHLIDEEHKP